MDKFTASNGIWVARDGSSLMLSHGHVTPDDAVALREFFQAERDEELGRWRWPEDPTYVVYPRPDHVQLVNELSGNALNVAREFANGSTGLCRAALAYFEAHPERKPWEDANRDEVWLFKSEGRGHALAWRAEDGWDVIDQRGNYHKGIEDVPAEMVAHSFYGWENATAVRLLPVESGT